MIIGSRVSSRAIPLCRRALFAPNVHTRALSTLPPSRKPVLERLREWAIKRLTVPSTPSSDSSSTPSFPSFIGPQSFDKDSLLKFIMGTPRIQENLKLNPAIPKKLATNKAEFKREGLDEPLKEVFKAMTTRLEERAKNEEHKGNRLNNPLAATLTTTGGGKSFFLDELGILDHTDLENFCSNPEMKNILQNSVAVAITFNGTTPFRKEIDEIYNSSLGLAIRALYSYFINDTMPFKDFVAQMGWWFNQLTLEVAIECIMLHSKKGVLLLVDEIMKSGGEKDDLDLINGKVSQIGSCLDTLTTQFNTVLTTLNMLATEKETKYGRLIAWITLAPLTLYEATSLFGDVSHFPILRQCIADCNGHKRSLETLKVVWEEFKDKEFSYPMLIQEVGRRMDRKYSQLSIPLIRAALRGYKVDLGDSPDGKLTYEKYLEKGLYLNTLGESRFIPRVSPLQLLLFALSMAGSDPLSVEDKCARAILRLFRLEESFTWQQYEQFHAYWEVLYSTLFANEPRTITTLYTRPSAEDYKKIPFSNLVLDPSFNLSQKSVNLLEWQDFFPHTLPQKPKPKKSNNKPDPTPAELEKLDREMLEQLELDEHRFSKDDLSKSVIMPASNNPGFDIVCFEMQMDGEPVVLCVECWFSDPEVTTKMSKADVAKKRNLTRRQFYPYFLQEGASLCGFTLKEENVYLVVCAFRKTNDNICEDLPANTIVLNRQQLEALYTPSLASRPQFIVSEEERNV